MKLLERHVQQAGEDFLQYDGWRIFHLEQNFSERKRKLVGEMGAPDTLAIRYTGHRCIGHGCSGEHCNPVELSRAQVVHIEWKRPKGRIPIHQRIWHEAERKRGALTWIAGVDFHPTFDEFKAFYANSGLQRRLAAKARNG